MSARENDHYADGKLLRRCINDLLSVVALSALWIGEGSSHITPTLAEMLVSVLDLDFVYVMLNEPVADEPAEVVRFANPRAVSSPSHEEISNWAREWVGRGPQQWPHRVANSASGGETTFLPVRLGVNREIGWLVAGAQREDFPNELENLILRVAANQAWIGLQEVRIIEEERRLSAELDRRVVQRTAELAHANEELRKEIVERKKMQERLIESESRLLEAQRLSHTGSWTHDLVSGQVTVSPEMARIFGVASDGEALTAEFFFGRIHQDDVASQSKSYAEAVREKRGFDSEYRIVLPDGSLKHIHNTGHPKLNELGELVGFVGTAIDMTQHRASEEALARARSELAHVSRVTSLGVLTAAMAHEVNQPLSGIVTNASTCVRMLSGDPPNVEGARETARRTIRDANRASDVITRLRTLYSKKDLALDCMDLNEAVQEVATLCLGELQRNRVILRQELEPCLPPIMGDRIQLQQVILNLLRNASDAMRTIDDRPRDLLIATKRDAEGLVRLTVKDAGVGFEPQARDRLFQAFYTTKKDGMGIGLSISRSIIEAHRGRLWATANEGFGATFSFVIPTQPEAPPGSGA